MTAHLMEMGDAHPSKLVPSNHSTIEWPSMLQYTILLFYVANSHKMGASVDYELQIRWPWKVFNLTYLQNGRIASEKNLSTISLPGTKANSTMDTWQTKNVYENFWKSVKTKLHNISYNDSALWKWPSSHNRESTYDCNFLFAIHTNPISDVIMEACRK